MRLPAGRCLSVKAAAFFVHTNRLSAFLMPQMRPRQSRSFPPYRQNPDSPAGGKMPADRHLPGQEVFLPPPGPFPDAPRSSTPCTRLDPDGLCPLLLHKCTIAFSRPIGNQASKAHQRPYCSLLRSKLVPGKKPGRKSCPNRHRYPQTPASTAPAGREYPPIPDAQ